MASLFDTTRNLSFYTIPVGWLTAIVPHLYAVSVYESSSKKKFDTTKPRSFMAKLDDDQTIDQATKNTVIRGEGAQQNGIENLGLFAAAVVAGNVARLDNSYLNALSGGYIATRIVYNLLYLNSHNSTMANMRTAAYLSGIGLILTMFISAGNSMRLM